MKHKVHTAWCWNVVAICMLAAIAGNTTVTAEEEGGSSLPVNIVIDATYASAYYWRGASAGTGTNFLQPSVDVSYTSESEDFSFTVGANVWYSQGIEDAGVPENNGELDYTVYVGTTVWALDISAGVIDYMIPHGFPFADRHVLEGNLGVGVNSLPFDNSVTVYLNLDGDDDNSVYLAPSVGTTYKNLGLGLTAGIVLGESAYYDTTGTELVDITPSVSYSIPGDAETTISFNVGYNPHTHTKITFITLGTSFNID